MLTFQNAVGATKMGKTLIFFTETHVYQGLWSWQQQLMDKKGQDGYIFNIFIFQLVVKAAGSLFFASLCPANISDPVNSSKLNWLS